LITLAKAGDNSAVRSWRRNIIKRLERFFWRKSRKIRKMLDFTVRSVLPMRVWAAMKKRLKKGNLRWNYSQYAKRLGEAVLGSMTWPRYM
jgi:hypothetical protein